MANKANSKAKQGATLQSAFEEGLNRIPQMVLEHQLAKKLKAQGVTLPKKRLAELAERILSGEKQTHLNIARGTNRHVQLSFDENDVEQILARVQRIYETTVPDLIPGISERMSKSVLRKLKERWPQESELQRADISAFRGRMEVRWREPLDRLRMLLTMIREWCGTINKTQSRDPQKKQTRKVLVRFLTRGCQVADEIICLLENGFADGAMARWRTLHEIAIVAAVIAKHGDEITARYLDHQHVESKRAMEKYIVTSPQLGYRPLAKAKQQSIRRAYDRVTGKYGKNFGADYGWAGLHLKKERPTFIDLEASVGRSHMRSHYQMGNDNVHAGVKSMYVRLGLLGDYDGLLAGRSNAGLAEPGQNTAHTLAHLACVVGLSEPIMDDNVIGEMIVNVSNEIPGSFARVERKLVKEAKSVRRGNPAFS
jgi:hypothetical protein